LFSSLKGYETLIAIFFLTLFLFIHLPGVRSGSLVQRITSAIKIILFLSLIVGCFVKGPGQNPAWQNLQAPVLQGGLILALLRAIQLILGTYDGWMAVSFFAEEDSNPGRNIPKSYLIGALTIAILYIAINAAILYVLPVAAISKSTLAASDAARIVFGSRGSDFMILISIFSLISILNAYMMIPSRILYGLSRDGFFISRGTTVNKGGTPYYSLLFCYVISVLLVIFSSFERLFSLGAFLLTIVSTFAFASLIVLRKKEPGMTRPYKAWGYPYSTYFACIVSLVLVAGFAIQDRTSLFISAVITILSIPLYKLFVKKQTPANPD
jgi:APA family basic amino acid/polyamine antiporter